jgi:hypothetical protein
MVNLASREKCIGWDVIYGLPWSDWWNAICLAMVRLEPPPLMNRCGLFLGGLTDASRGVTWAMLEGWDSVSHLGFSKTRLGHQGELVAVIGGVTSTLLGSQIVNQKRWTKRGYRPSCRKIQEDRHVGHHRNCSHLLTCLSQVLWRSFRENWTIWLTSAPWCYHGAMFGANHLLML